MTEGWTIKENKAPIGFQELTLNSDANFIAGFMNDEKWKIADIPTQYKAAITFIPFLIEDGDKVRVKTLDEFYATADDEVKKWPVLVQEGEDDPVVVKTLEDFYLHCDRDSIWRIMRPGTK